MPALLRMGTRVHRVGLLLALVAMAGCARESVENVDVRATGLPRPQMIVVHEFAASPGAVTLDSAIGARVTEMLRSEPTSQQQMEVSHEVARIVADNLVKEVSKLGLPAYPAASAPPATGPTLIIDGQFVTVDQGNRLRRAMIGFGAGASEVRTLVQVYEVTPDGGRRLVEDFYTTVKSSRKPGMGPMVGVGAAAGRAATSAVVSGALGLATAHSQTVEGDAKHTADEIVKVLKGFFAQQGWIAP